MLFFTVQIKALIEGFYRTTFSELKIDVYIKKLNICIQFFGESPKSLLTIFGKARKVVQKRRGYGDFYFFLIYLSHENFYF